MKLHFILSIFCLLNFPSFSQIEELTDKEKAYRDSITSLNVKNENIAKSKEAYNLGIKLYSEKKFIDAIEEFKKSINLDSNFIAAYYNKGVAENENQNYNDAIKTMDKLSSEFDSVKDQISKTQKRTRTDEKSIQYGNKRNIASNIEKFFVIRSN